MPKYSSKNWLILGLTSLAYLKWHIPGSFLDLGDLITDYSLCFSDVFRSSVEPKGKISTRNHHRSVIVFRNQKGDQIS